MVSNYLNPTFCFRVHDSPQKKKKSWCICYICILLPFNLKKVQTKVISKLDMDLYLYIYIYIILDIDI